MISEEIDWIKTHYPDVSNPVKIYRTKKQWKIVVQGRCGLYAEGSDASFGVAWSKLIGHIRGHWPKPAQMDLAPGGK